MESNLSTKHFNVTTTNDSELGCGLETGSEWYLHIPEFILLIWSFTLFIMVLLPVFCCFLKSKPLTIAMKHQKGKAKINNSNSNGNVRLWRLGLFVSTFYVLREIFDITGIGIGLATLDWCTFSAYWIAILIAEVCYVISYPLNFLFYIYRLYTVHSQPGTNVLYGDNIYYFLITLVIFYTMSLMCACYGIVSYNSVIVIICETLNVILESIIAIIVTRLFLKPLINITVQQRLVTKGGHLKRTTSGYIAKGSNVDNDGIGTDININYKDGNYNLDSKYKQQTHETMKNDRIIIFVTKCLVLSTVSLFSTNVVTIIAVLAESYCDTCWFKYISWGSWTLDTSINVFCLMCSFTYGTKYYNSLCRYCHNWFLASVIIPLATKKAKKLIMLSLSQQDNIEKNNIQTPPTISTHDDEK